MNEKNSDLESKNLSVFNINELMKETYNKIAKWHNEDGDGAGLKNLSIELIEDIAGEAFSHLGVPYNKETKIQMDEETRKKVEAEKAKIISDAEATVTTEPPKDTSEKDTN